MSAAIRFKMNKNISKISVLDRITTYRNMKFGIRFASAAAPSSDDYHARKISLMMFGSTTDVGKTIVSAGLCRAALANERKVCYVKPIQTGELDEYFIQFYANPKGFKDIICRTIHHWSPAISPHLAAALEGHEEGDDELVRRLQNEIGVFENAASGKDSFVVVETAGGVLTPGPSRTLQADIYRRLRLPLVLVGDSKLGGISTTLSAIESLRLRGYSIHAVIMIETEDSNVYGNVEAVQNALDRAFACIPGDSALLPAWSDSPPPRVFSLPALPHEKLLHGWFAETDAPFQSIYSHIVTSITMERAAQIEMLRKGPEVLWWPFTQHGALKPSGDTNINFIESAHGDHFRVIRLLKRSVTNTGSPGTPAAASTPSSPSGDKDNADASVQSLETDLDLQVSSDSNKMETLDFTLHAEETLDASASWWTQVWISCSDHHM